jgi:hypothetical protein
MLKPGGGKGQSAVLPFTDGAAGEAEMHFFRNL